MKGPFGIAWLLAGPIVRRRLLSGAKSGRPPELRWAVWQRIPNSMWKRLDYSGLAEAEEAAEISLLEDSGGLGEVFLREELGGWTFSASSLLWLWRQVNETPPATVVEFGSGLTTRLFALFARRRQSLGLSVPTIISFDHDESWINKTRDRLRDLRLDEFVDLRLAELEPTTGIDGAVATYSSAIVDSALANRSVDLCLIDGPPGDNGRVAVLPLVANRLAAGATIILDDAARPREQRAVDDWADTYKTSISSPRFVATAKGIAVFSWSKSSISSAG